MRLLVADDEVNLAKALQAVLEDAGYNCDVCFDGNSAIRLISQEIYDGLILDIMMPEKNGYEVLNQIRKQKNDIPVLLLSALNEVDDKVTGFDLGANDYLSKPFSTKELIARVKVMLKENVIDDSYLQYQDILLNKKEETLATVYKGNIIKNLIMDCQSYTKYRPNETTGGIFVSWRRKEELPTGA